MRSIKNIVCDEDGSELVEFAFSFVILFSLVFAIIQFCLAVYAANFVAFAAQQGSRYAMVRGMDWPTACSSTVTSNCYASASDVQNYVLNLPHLVHLQAGNITLTPLTTTSTGGACTTSKAGCRVQVKVSYTLPFNMPFFPTASVPLFTSTSIETIQW